MIRVYTDNPDSYRDGFYTDYVLLRLFYRSGQYNPIIPIAIGSTIFILYRHYTKLCIGLIYSLLWYYMEISENPSNLCAIIESLVRIVDSQFTL